MGSNAPRRKFLSGLAAAGGAAGLAAQQPSPRQRGAAPLPFPGNPGGLAELYRARSGKRRRVSSYSPNGHNSDAVRIDSGEAAVLADLKGAGCIRHIWTTVSSPETDYLRRLVLRAWWDGESNPSVEAPLGDFFGVGHGRVSNFWSQPLNMVTGGLPERQSRAAMNCFFPMPFAAAAKVTIENQGERPVDALYFYLDYELYDRPLADALRFHAWWRREMPTKASVNLGREAMTFAKVNELANPDGAANYTLCEAYGRGHYVGCVLSVDHINPIPGFAWFGEGDDMIFIDGEEKPSIMGTGTEDYFCAAWGFPGGRNSTPYHGVSLAGPVEGPDAYSGKWSMYRFHIQDPVMFEKSIRVTIEAGHANVHANDYSSVAYWYQTEPHRSFPALPPAAQRLPLSDVDSLRRFFQTR
jgi:hypothetical protein